MSANIYYIRRFLFIMKLPHLEIKAEKGKPRNKIKGNGVNLVSWLFFIFLEIKECLFYL